MGNMAYGCTCQPKISSQSTDNISWLTVDKKKVLRLLILRPTDGANCFKGWRKHRGVRCDGLGMANGSYGSRVLSRS